MQDPTTTTATFSSFDLQLPEEVDASTLISDSICTLPEERILWATRVPHKNTLLRGAGNFGLAVLFPALVVVLSVCQLIFLATKNTTTDWTQWVLVIWTLLCVLALYVIFLHQNIFGIRLDVVTNFRVMNVIVRTSKLDGHTVEKSFLPLLLLDTVHAAHEQVTFNPRKHKQPLHKGGDGDLESQGLVSGYKPSKKLSLTTQRVSRRAIHFAYVPDGDQLKHLVESERSKLLSSLSTLSTSAITTSSSSGTSSNSSSILSSLLHLQQIEPIVTSQDIKEPAYQEMVLPYLQHGGERILRIFAPERWKRWLYGRRMPYILGISIWLFFFSIWLAILSRDSSEIDNDTSSSSSTSTSSSSGSYYSSSASDSGSDSSSSASSLLDATSSTSGSITTGDRTANKVFLGLIVTLCLIFALFLPPIWLTLDNSLAGIDLLMEKSILFLRRGYPTIPTDIKGERDEKRRPWSRNSSSVPLDHIFPITLERDELSDKGSVYLWGIDWNNELVEVRDMSPLEKKLCQQLVILLHENVSGSSAASSDRKASKEKSSEGQFHQKYEEEDSTTSATELYGEL